MRTKTNMKLFTVFMYPYVPFPHPTFQYRKFNMFKTLLKNMIYLFLISDNKYKDHSNYSPTSEMSPSSSKKLKFLKP